MLLPNLDVLPVNIMEARNFITAREMVTDGNWILTTLNGQPRYEKPPFPTWITALSGMAFGFENLYTMRLPVVIAALLLVFFAYRICRLLPIPKSQQIASCLILITSFYVWFSGRDNQWDLYCHAFMLGGIYYLWKIFRSDGNAATNTLFGALFIGCSMLSKGPVSVYGLLLPFLVSYAIAFKFRHRKQNVIPVLILSVLALAIGFSWPIYVRFADPETVYAIASKEASRWKSYNTRPVYYYWNFFLQSGIWAVPSLMALLYPYMKNRVSDLSSYKLTFWWTVSAVVLLSLVPEKKSRYLLPVLIPMALNTGFYIEYLHREFAKRLPAIEKWPVFAGFGILGIAGICFPVLIFTVDGLGGTVFMNVVASVALCACGLVLFYGLYALRFQTVFLSAIALQICVIAFALPLSGNSLRPVGYKSVASVRSYANVHRIKVYEFGNYSPEIVYAFGRKIPKATPSEATFGILATAEDSLAIFKTYPTAEKIDFINLNASSKRKSKTSNRLYRDFYVVKN